MARMRGLWTHLERLGAGRGVGGIGTRGPGESQIETDRRLARDRISALRRRLDDVQVQRAPSCAPSASARTCPTSRWPATRTPASRRCSTRSPAPRSASATGSSTRSTRRRARCGCDGRTYLVTDTVGFIRKLPHQLVDAFAATLEETQPRRPASCTSSTRARPRRSSTAMTRAVEDVLEEIGAGDTPRLLVLNKADVLDEERRRELAFRHPEGVLVSAAHRRGARRAGRARSPTSSSARCATSSCSCRSPRAGRCPSCTTSPATSSARTRPTACRVSARLPAVVAERFDRYAVNGAG